MRGDCDHVVGLGCTFNLEFAAVWTDTRWPDSCDAWPAFATFAPRFPIILLYFLQPIIMPTNSALSLVSFRIHFIRLSSQDSGNLNWTELIRCYRPVFIRWSHTCRASFSQGSGSLHDVHPVTTEIIQLNSSFVCGWVSNTGGSLF